MKRTTLSLLVSCVALVSARADVIWYEGFDYANGPIVVVSTNASGTMTNWFRHSGTASPSDAIVNNKRLEIGTTVSGVRQDDVNRLLCTTGGCSYTNGAQILYASLTVNFTNLPNPNGAYFAHFHGPGANDFQGRIWALTGNPGGTSNVFSALPGCYRVGISGTSGSTPSKIIPVDLSTNTYYQLVIGWNPTGGDVDGIPSQSGVLWVNPISSSDPSSGATTDAGSTRVSTGFAFRQATGFASGPAQAILTVTNLTTATSFDEAATNVWSTNAVSPIIVRQSNTGTLTVFVGASTNVWVVANGQNLLGLTYQWRKGGANYSNPNGNSNVLDFASLATTNSGSYDVVVTTPYGLSVTSAPINLTVTDAPVAPTITQQPTNTTVYFGATATLYVAATGPGTITYQWKLNGNDVFGEVSPTLVIPNVQTNNGTTGTYRCAVSNEFGGKLSDPADLSAIPIPAVSIAFLRSLVGPPDYVVTQSNPSQLYRATGVITTYTNLTTGNTASYYLQDSTAGINIFATFGSSFRPQMGDVVEFIGYLESFNSNLELFANTVAEPLTGYTVLSNNPALLPAATVIPFGVTNNLSLCETNLEGRVVMLTNVYFGANAGNTTATNANTTVVVTNAAGETFNVFFSSQNMDTAGQTLPAFAWSVIGPLTQSLPNNGMPRNAGFSVTVTRFADIVTNEPPAVQCAVTHSGNSSTVTWTAVPYGYSYSVWAATSVSGPYTRIASGLTFPTTTGSYTDTNAGGNQKYYRVTTP